MLSTFPNRFRTFIWFLIFTFTLSTVPHFEFLFPIRLHFFSKAMAAEDAETLEDKLPDLADKEPPPPDKSSDTSSKESGAASSDSSSSSEYQEQITPSFSFKVDDFKLQKPGEAETLYWVTFGVTIAIIVFSIFGGIVIYASVKWRGVLKKYAQPGIDYRTYQVPSALQKQILSASKQSPDPSLRELYSGYRKCSWGVSVAGFLMMVAIIGTLFMPPMLVLTLGIVLMVVFMSIFGIAGALAVKRGRPFVVLMGLRMGYFQPAQGGYQQPQYNYQQPPGGYQQPPTGYQQPPASYQQPSSGYPRPPTGHQQPQGGPPQTLQGPRGPLPPPQRLEK